MAEVAEKSGIDGLLQRIDELERLAKLRDEGVITKEDYETKKNQILGI